MNSPGAVPRSLRGLQAACDACRDCALGEPATQAVVGEGPRHARLMVVGEQPGDHEDRTGRVFVGPAGRLLDGALQRAGIERRAVFLTNAVKHFGFAWHGKRRLHKTPGQREVEACQQWLQAEIARVAPQAFVALGATAARALLGRATPVLRNRGRWLARDDGRAVLVTVHPSALLRLRGPDFDEGYAAFVRDLGQAADRV